MILLRCSKTLVEIFDDEAIYYGRWREFRGETKHEQNELEDVEEEELAEELDLFAVSESEAVFNEAFMVRLVPFIVLVVTTPDRSIVF